MRDRQNIRTVSCGSVSYYVQADNLETSDVQILTLNFHPLQYVERTDSTYHYDWYLDRTTMVYLRCCQSYLPVSTSSKFETDFFKLDFLNRLSFLQFTSSTATGGSRILEVEMGSTGKDCSIKIILLRCFHDLFIGLDFADSLFYILRLFCLF